MLKKWYASEWIFFRRKLFITFLTVLAILAADVALNYIYYTRHPDKAKSKIFETMKDKKEKEPLRPNRVYEFVNLFIHNLICCLATALSGLVPFLFLPVLLILTFGGTFGVAMAAFNILVTNSYFTLLAVTLPHGVFEIPAIVYASSIGLYLTIQMSRKVIHRQNSDTLSVHALCRRAVCSFLLVVLPLLLIAALVEVFVTPG